LRGEVIKSPPGTAFPDGAAKNWRVANGNPNLEKSRSGSSAQ
jgi:hypothetical protein